MGFISKPETWKAWESSRLVTIYFKQRLIYKICFLIIINGAPHPILSKIRLMVKIPLVYSDPYTHSHSEFA